MPFELPEGWAWSRFGAYTVNRDSERKPVSSANRATVAKIYDYYGASGTIDKVDGFLFNEQLLLIGEDGANLVTRSKPIAFFADGQYWVNNHAHCIDAIDKTLLGYICIYINAINLEPYVTGSAQPKMTQDKMNSILVPVPPYTEQLKICKKLQVAFDCIDNIEADKEDIGELILNTKSRILDLAIRGKLVPQDPNDEPASVLLERIRAEKEELIKQGKIKRDKKESVIFKGEDNSYYEKIDLNIKKIDDEIPYQISNNWEYVRLSKICWLSDGTKIQNSKLPYLDVKSLRSCDFTNNAESGKYIKKETKIILVDGENSGEVFTVPCDGYMGSTFKVLETINCICNDYIKIILSYYKNMLKNSKTGSAIPHLNKVLFKSIIVGIPPIEEQIRIVHQVNSVFSLIDNII